jgi:hypothetical protein
VSITFDEVIKAVLVDIGAPIIGARQHPQGIRGPHGGYELARECRGVTANDILRAASTVHEAGEELNYELVAKLVLPAGCLQGPD